jgi:hypothetical protein
MDKSKMTLLSNHHKVLKRSNGKVFLADTYAGKLGETIDFNGAQCEILWQGNKKSAIRYMRDLFGV